MNMSEECIFCKIVSGKIPTDKVFENDEIIAFKDIRPALPVHVLFVPKKHYVNLNDLDDAGSAMLAKLLVAVRDVAKQLKVADTGYRVVINTNKNAGQEVLHLHVHLLGGRSMGAMG